MAWGQGLGCSHQQGRPHGPARLSRGLNHPASRYKAGAPPGAEEPGSRRSPDAQGGGWGSPGQLAEFDPQHRKQLPDTGGQSRVRPSGARAWPEQVPGASRPRPGDWTAPGSQLQEGLVPGEHSLSSLQNAACLCVLTGPFFSLPVGLVPSSRL